MKTNVPLLFAALLIPLQIAFSHAEAERTYLGPQVLTATHIDKIKRGITDRLRDPESARFDRIGSAQFSDGSTTVCGYVNAKNLFGGYVGKEPFIGIGTHDFSQFRVMHIGGTVAEMMAIIDVCGQIHINLK